MPRYTTGQRGGYELPVLAKRFSTRCCAFLASSSVKLRFVHEEGLVRFYHDFAVYDYGMDAPPIDVKTG